MKPTLDVCGITICVLTIVLLLSTSHANAAKQEMGQRELLCATVGTYVDQNLNMVERLEKAEKKHRRELPAAKLLPLSRTQAMPRQQNALASELRNRLLAYKASIQALIQTMNQHKEQLSEDSEVAIRLGCDNEGERIRNLYARLSSLIFKYKFYLRRAGYPSK